MGHGMQVTSFSHGRTEYLQAGPDHVNLTSESRITTMGSFQRVADPLLSSRARLQALFVDIWCQVLATNLISP